MRDVVALALALTVGGCAFTSRPMIPGTGDEDSGAGYAANDVATLAPDAGAMTGISDADARSDAAPSFDAALSDADMESCDDLDGGAVDADVTDAADADVTDATTDADVTDASRGCPVRDDAGPDVTGAR